MYTITIRAERETGGVEEEEERFLSWREGSVSASDLKTSAFLTKDFDRKATKHQLKAMWMWESLIFSSVGFVTVMPRELLIIMILDV